MQHIALTVNEELDLQARLLDDLDEDVDVTHNRMRAAQKKLKSVMARSGKLPHTVRDSAAHDCAGCSAGNRFQACAPLLSMGSCCPVLVGRWKSPNRKACLERKSVLSVSFSLPPLASHISTDRGWDIDLQKATTILIVICIS